MRVKILAPLAVLLALAAPAQARAAGFHGTVIAKQPQRGTLVLAGPGGVGLTVHARARAALGSRVSLRGSRLRDGTIRASRLTVLSRTRHALIRGVVVRQLARSTIVATGRSVITIHHRAARRRASSSDHGGLRPGTIADFRVRIDDDDLFENHATVVGQAGDVEIEGALVSVSPLVISVEGLPITITVPATVTLPIGLAAGQRIELIVHVTAPNVFTLVAIEVENANKIIEEVEVEGFVTASSTTQITVNSRSAAFTFTAPPGVTLPVLPIGTFVEVRGARVNGVLTVERLRVEDDDDDDDGDHRGRH
jgi:hypothetical protein